jgi:hypothetical protein
MSVDPAHPSDQVCEDRPSGSPRPRVARRGISWIGVVAGVTVLLAASQLLLEFPDRDGVTKAATRASSAKTRRPAPASRRPPRTAAQQGKPQSAIATIYPDATPQRVPPSFLGLSTEYWSLPGYEGHMAVFGRVLSLLHVPGDGRLVLRVGGNSADHTLWESTVRRMPHWVFELTPAWLRAARALVHLVSVRLILDLNLVTDSPLVATHWARAAANELPHGSIAGFEIGNEPDIYSRWFWVTRMARAGGAETGILPRDLTARGYARDFHTYARLLEQIAPGVPLLGPAAANPSRHLSWISTLVARARGDLGIVSGHRYPYSACVLPTSEVYPTIARVLSEKASAGIARSLQPAVRVAHRAGLPFRVTELNSVTCGGLPGVSNAFATALWAPDALFELIRAGVDGVNIHVRTDAINAAFALKRQGLVPRPLLYGLIMFRRALGTGARLVPVRLSAGRSAPVKVWAVRVAGGRIHVLVIDKGSRPVTVDLRVPGAGPASVQRLLAPSAAATSGVTLDGQWLGRDGRWKGRRSTRTIEPAGDGYPLKVGRYSAALATIRIGPPSAAPSAQS